MKTFYTAARANSSRVTTKSQVGRVNTPTNVAAILVALVYVPTMTNLWIYWQALLRVSQVRIALLDKGNLILIDYSR